MNKFEVLKHAKRVYEMFKDFTQDELADLAIKWLVKNERTKVKRELRRTSEESVDLDLTETDPIGVAHPHENWEVQLNDIMMSMPEEFRYRWCEAEACGCMGCANRSGQLPRYGFTKSDWKNWVLKNPARGDRNPIYTKSVDGNWSDKSTEAGAAQRVDRDLNAIMIELEKIFDRVFDK